MSFEQTPAGREIYVSTTSFRSRHLKDILALCEHHAIAALELSAVQSCDLSLLGATCWPRHYLVHNYFPPPKTPFVLNLGSQNEDVLGRSLSHCRAAIDLSARLGADRYAAHGAFAAELSPDQLGHPERQAHVVNGAFASYQDTYATLVGSAKSLTVYAKARGVRFLIENNVYSSLDGDIGRRLTTMVEATELARLVRDVGDPNFGLLVDMGHLNVSAHALGFDRHAFIDRLEPSIGAFHLSANDGLTDQHLPFARDEWFLTRLRDFPDAAVTVELSGQSIDRIVAMRDLVREWL